MKRVFDICFSLLLLVALAPILCLCALCVWLSSKGPILYAHSRVGRYGRSFRCWKFRSMYMNAEEKLQLILAANPCLLQEWKTFYKLKKDPRVTWIGKFLRKVSLDELPQLFNVLKGDMSFVGPRPVTEDEVREYLKEKANTILSVRPGLTSLWIVKGRNQFSLEKRVEIEEYYVQNRSFWLDCQLIIRTVWIMIFPKGAY